MNKVKIHCQFVWKWAKESHQEDHITGEMSFACLSWLIRVLGSLVNIYIYSSIEFDRRRRREWWGYAIMFEYTGWLIRSLWNLIDAVEEKNEVILVIVQVSVEYMIDRMTVFLSLSAFLVLIEHRWCNEYLQWVMVTVMLARWDLYSNKRNEELFADCFY